MVFCCLLSMVSSEEMMPVRNVSVMPRFLVSASLMMLGRLKMMPRGMSMVFSRFLVMLCTLVSSHLDSPLRNYTIMIRSVPLTVMAAGWPPGIRA